jgi:hypothetical protein
MRLSQTALQRVREPRIRMRVAVALGITDQAVAKLIKRNSDNLTKIAAIHVIKEETGLCENEILEPDNVAA